MFYVSLSGARSGAQANFLDTSAGTLLFLSQGTSADESSKGHGSGVGQGGLVGMDPAQLAQTMENAVEGALARQDDQDLPIAVEAAKLAVNASKAAQEASQAKMFKILPTAFLMSRAPWKH